MTKINKLITVRPSVHNVNNYGRIELATLNAGAYINLITTERSLTISPSEAKQLRDQLLEIYPLEVTKPSKFKVGDKVAYQSIVGYGARGMAGRNGLIKEVLEKGWYIVTFTGPIFDTVLKVHEDYLVERVEQRAFQAGDRVRYKDGDTFSRGLSVVTLDRPHGTDRWWFKETGTHARTSTLELVTPAASMPPAEPAINTDLGRFIVAKMDNGNYLPGTKPRVHTSAKSANDEATRLANDHGGTFHVLRASFEASRPVVVQPPVKTAKL